MDVTDEVDLGNGHKIEFGRSSWDPSAESIRNRYPTSSGGFSPHSSSELPIEDLAPLVMEAARRDKIDKKAAAQIIRELATSIERQVP